MKKESERKRERVLCFSLYLYLSLSFSLWSECEKWMFFGKERAMRKKMKVYTSSSTLLLYKPNPSLMEGKYVRARHYYFTSHKDIENRKM